MSLVDYDDELTLYLGGSGLKKTTKENKIKKEKDISLNQMKINRLKIRIEEFKKELERLEKIENESK